MLFFSEVIKLLAMETNRYHHKYAGTFDVVPSLIPDVTESESFLFLAIIIQMENDI
jgi:hypothetical protein